MNEVGGLSNSGCGVCVTKSFPQLFRRGQWSERGGHVGGRLRMWIKSQSVLPRSLLLEDSGSRRHPQGFILDLLACHGMCGLSEWLRLVPISGSLPLA